MFARFEVQKDVLGREWEFTDKRLLAELIVFSLVRFIFPNAGMWGGPVSPPMGYGPPMGGGPWQPMPAAGGGGAMPNVPGVVPQSPPGPVLYARGPPGASGGPPPAPSMPPPPTPGSGGGAADPDSMEFGD